MQEKLSSADATLPSYHFEHQHAKRPPVHWLAVTLHQLAQLVTMQAGVHRMSSLLIVHCNRQVSET